MNQAFVARAPGKLFLLGEYAVLDGAAAVVAAVDRHLEIRLRIRRGGELTRVAAPGLGGHLEFPTRCPGPVPPAVRFVAAAIEHAVRALPVLASAGLDIDASGDGLEAAGEEPGRRAADAKLGLGGSAAVTAATAAALFGAAGCDPAAARDRVFAVARAAHRSAQDGCGSGADVAASIYGGALLFRPASEAPPGAARLGLPGGAEVLTAWSGRAAATAPLVRRYLALDPGGCRRDFVEAARAAVSRFLSAGDDARTAAGAVDDAGRALEKLGRDGGLPLLTPELARLVTLARDAGAGAKLSGAGGGDCAVALAPDGTTAARVRATWRAAGFSVLDLGIDPRGVSVAQA